MGCLQSGLAELPQPKHEDELVGKPTNAAYNIDLDKIPAERKAMAELENEAARQTIYYRKKRRFPDEPTGLVYNDDPYKVELRRLLDEPVGQFYLLEFSRAKEEKAFEALLSLWVEIQRVRASDADSLSDATAVLDEEVYTPEVMATNEAAFAAWPRPLTRDNMLEIQKIAFETMHERQLSTKFKARSEYKRYKMKYVKVYNALSHQDFDFMSTLGKGSFGRVFRVRHKASGKQYAMKVMSKKRILSGAENATQVAIEKSTLLLCKSPNVVKVYFAFQTSRALFLCLELLEGGTLNTCLKAYNGQVPSEVIRFHAAQICLGLDHLHSHGILYRDLKPLNVLVDRKGNAVLTDMGLAAKFKESHFDKRVGAVNMHGNKTVAPRRSLEIVASKDLKCVGTFGYRAPELLKADKERAGYGTGVDYWALGVTMYYLANGKMPFKNRNPSVIGGPKKLTKEQELKLQGQPRKWASDCDADLVQAVDDFLNPDPAARLDFDGAKAHAYFASIDWTKLANFQLPSPYKPSGLKKRSKDEKPQFEGLSEAMAQFSNDAVLEMFGGENEIQEEYRHVSRKDQKLFTTWDYAPDSELQTAWDDVEKRRSKSQADALALKRMSRDASSPSASASASPSAAATPGRTLIDAATVTVETS